MGKQIERSRRARRSWPARRAACSTICGAGRSRLDGAQGARARRGRRDAVDGLPRGDHRDHQAAARRSGRRCCSRRRSPTTSSASARATCASRRRSRSRADFVGVHEIQHAYYMVSGMGRARDLVRVLERREAGERDHLLQHARRHQRWSPSSCASTGFDAEAISSDLTQKDRERVMGRMKAKNLRFLVATDVAARGIDISRPVARHQLHVPGVGGGLRAPHRPHRARRQERAWRSRSSRRASSATSTCSSSPTRSSRRSARCRRRPSRRPRARARRSTSCAARSDRASRPPSGARWPSACGRPTTASAWWRR